MINGRLASNAEAIRSLSMSSELAELRKVKELQIQRLIAEQAALRQLVTTKAAGAQRQTYLRRIEENAATLRKLAGGEVDWSGRLKRKTATAEVQKAHMADYDLDIDQIGKAVRAAVDQAMSNLGKRIDILNKRAR
jgi:hypothetical protein